MTDGTILRLRAMVSVFFSGPLDMFLPGSSTRGGAATIKLKKGQKRKHQKKLERWRTFLILVSRVPSGFMDCFS